MSADQRANFRVVMKQDAQLRLGKQTYDCTIEDESAGGFAARLSQPLHFDRSLQMDLLLDGGVTVVRVARCKITSEGTMIGLQRVKDLASKEELADASWSVKSYFSGWRRKGEGMSLGTIAAIFLLSVGGLWGVVRFGYGMLPAPDRGAETTTAFGHVSATYVVESRRALAQQFEDYLQNFRASRVGQRAEGNEKIQENYARFIRQRLLASNQAAIALRMSTEQMNTIRAAVRSVEDEVVSLSKTLKTDEADLASVAHGRLEEAEKTSLDCLTQDQRLLWATLTGMDLPDGEKQK